MSDQGSNDNVSGVVGREGVLTVGNNKTLIGNLQKDIEKKESQIYVSEAFLAVLDINSDIFDVIEYCKHFIEHKLSCNDMERSIETIFGFFDLGYITDGSEETITFLGLSLWSSSDDERIYFDEKEDVREPIEAFVRREMKKISEILSIIVDGL